MGFLNLLIQKFQNTQIYLRTFKEENVIRKAYRTLGIPYSWLRVDTTLLIRYLTRKTVMFIITLY